ncbi:hydrolase 1, exosortase A system-associated [Janthinobacterium sp.]|uniref:hydrolase 1, exosortase A system-associated n=1 Tax=Janthinobacterium sp. TaxID=1871054 RepID=UPI00293D2759|nr:hydrolase 1, exosortase A system-associated [Janthinobacterium sp.]
MLYEERALSFACHGEQLIGVLALPQEQAAKGVLVVVGGPQYRAGSHRQFTLLARGLAAQGIPVLRFDYRGMGDSDGAERAFDDVGADLRAAIDAFMRAAPGLREVAVWGLCDGASAAMFYAPQDPRVSGLALLNPWVRSAGGLARATVKHYYGRRLLQAELWGKILRGRFAYRAALGEIGATVATLLRGGGAPPEAALPERLRAALAAFDGRVLLILSGADLTAREFSDLVAADAGWRRRLAAPGVTRRELPGADHTFSRRVWREQVADWTAAWLRSW